MSYSYETTISRYCQATDRDINLTKCKTEVRMLGSLSKQYKTSIYCSEEHDCPSKRLGDCLLLFAL
jgi:hypothetical protein